MLLSIITPIFKGMKKLVIQEIKQEKLYPYCPNCGARKKYYSDIIIHVDDFPWE